MSLLSGIRFISKDKREVKGISSIINNNSNNDKYKNKKLTNDDVNDDHDNEKNNDAIFKKRKSHKKDKVSKSNKKHKSKKNGKRSTDRNDIHYLDDRNDKGQDMNHRRKRAYDSSSSSSDGENNDDSHKIDDHRVRTKYGRNRGNNKSIGDDNYNNNNDDDDDDSVVDMNAIAREEEVKEREELKRDRDRVICRDDRREDRYDERYDNRYSSDNYHSRHDANNDHGNNSNSNVSNKKSQFDADRFKLLINSLKNKNKIDMKDQDKYVNGGNNNDNIVVVVDDDDNDDDVSTSKKLSKDVYIQKSDMNDCHAEKICFFHDDNDIDDNDGNCIYKSNNNSNGLMNNSDFTKQVPVVVTAITTATGTTNQSAAALLREKLKRNKMTTLTSTTSSAAVTNGTNVPTSQSVILDNKEMVTVQAKLHQLQEGDKSSKSGNKSESNGGGSYKKAHYNNDDMDDMDEIYKQNILRLGDRYKGSELSNAGAFGSGMKTGFDEESDIDMKMFERKNESNPAEMLQRQIKQMMKSQHDIKTKVSSCSRCIDSSTFRNQLILMKTDHCIISIKIDPDSLDKYHLELSSIQHNHSIVSCDNDTIEEMDRLKSYIADMFYRELDKSVLFIETAIHFNHHPHAYIDIIPIERGLEAEASMYFREAFTSCDEEWAQHRKIINVTAKRPLHHAIPKHFEYLSCLWQCSSSGSSINKSSSYTKISRQGSIAVDDDEIVGIVHPIESSASMDKDFCLDVVAGMLDLDPIRIRRKFLGMNTSDGRNNSSSNGKSKGKCITIQGETIEKEIISLKKMWEKYDIPTKLNGD